MVVYALCLPYNPPPAGLPGGFWFGIGSAALSWFSLFASILCPRRARAGAPALYQALCHFHDATLFAAGSKQNRLTTSYLMLDEWDTRHLWFG